MRLILYFFCFVDSVKSIHYTVRTLVRLFVSPRGQCGGPLSYSLSANKKPNYLGTCGCTHIRELRARRVTQSVAFEFDRDSEQADALPRHLPKI